jgi:uncharacterized protein DUF4214
MSTDVFGSLALARAYVDAMQQSVAPLVGAELIDALGRLDRAYDEFPELELDRPRRGVLEGLQSTAEGLPDRIAIPLLMYCAAAGPPGSSALAVLVAKISESDFHPLLSSVLCSLCQGREFCWTAIEPVLTVLRQRCGPETGLQLISQVVSCANLATEENASEFGDVLKGLLRGRQQLEIDSATLARAVGSARRRLSRPHLDPSRPASSDALLATAERLRSTLSPTRLGPHPDLGWPSGRLSFDEFLLQWPCEVELPVEPSDADFVEAACRAILLRGPDITEQNQYLRLLRDGVASRSWIIEDLLASKEFRSLERSLRIRLGGQLITGPDGPQEQTPAVIWPWFADG